MKTSFPRVELFQTEKRTLFSKLIGQEYQLSVRWPGFPEPTQKRFPVLYVLDGDTFFGLATSLTDHLHNVPPTILVGIGYDMQSWEEWLERRETDFKIPEVKDAPTDSHADQFLAALKQEIIPFVEANYPIDPGERSLYGFSSGGFFVLYALFHEPGLFRRYISGSGDMEIACPYMIAHDQQLLSRKKPDPIDLYMSVGELEENSHQPFHQLADTIWSKQYPGLRLITDIFTNETHSGGALALSYIHGLRKCYQP